MTDSDSNQYTRLAELLRLTHEATRRPVSASSARLLDRIAESEALRSEIRDLNSDLVALSVQLAEQRLRSREVVEANALLQLAKLLSDGAHARSEKLRHAIVMLKRQQRGAAS